MVAVVMAMGPVGAFHELKSIAVIVRAMAEHQRDLESMRLGYLAQRFPEASPIGKGKELALAILADGFDANPVDCGADEPAARRHPPP